MTKNTRREPKNPRKDEVATRDNQKPPLKKVAFISQSFSGPLPPPSILDDYERLFPTAGRSIIDQFLQESHHRRELEMVIVSSETGSARATVTNKRIGLFLAFLVVVLVVSLGWHMASLGKSEPAAWLVGTVLTGGVAAFITQKTTGRTPKSEPNHGDHRNG